MDNPLSWVLAGLGVLLILVAAAMARRALRLVRAGGRAQGTVVGVEETISSGSKGGVRRHYRPTVRFIASDGKTRTFTSLVGQGRRPADGATVTVLYDPNNPDEADLGGFSNTWLFPLVAALFGVPLLLIGVSMLRQ